MFSAVSNPALAAASAACSPACWAFNSVTFAESPEPSFPLEFVSLPLLVVPVSSAAFNPELAAASALALASACALASCALACAACSPLCWASNSAAFASTLGLNPPLFVFVSWPAISSATLVLPGVAVDSSTFVEELLFKPVLESVPLPGVVPPLLAFLAAASCACISFAKARNSALDISPFLNFFIISINAASL